MSVPARLSSALLLAVVWASGVSAQVHSESARLQFQECLLDVTGEPLSAREYDIRLRIYPGATSAVPLWESEGQVHVQLKSGCFQHDLGSTNPLPASIERFPMVWVSVTDVMGQEMAPRAFLAVNEQSLKSAEPVRPSSPVARSTMGPVEHSYESSVKYIPDVYVHGQLSFGLGKLGTGETYQAIISPFQPGMGGGYALGLAIGFRNIYQLEYRPRMVAVSDLNYPAIDTVIPMNMHVRNEFIHKLNLLAFKKVTGLRVPVLFVSYGWSAGGQVRHVDMVGDGFLDGSAQMIGVEAGVLQKVASVTFFVERHTTKFKQFSIQGLGSLQSEMEATFWYFGLHVGLRTGFSF